MAFAKGGFIQTNVVHNESTGLMITSKWIGIEMQEPETLMLENEEKTMIHNMLNMLDQKVPGSFETVSVILLQQGNCRTSRTRKYK